jgi:DNA modification methylase
MSYTRSRDDKLCTELHKNYPEGSEIVPIDSLTPYPGNARTHDDRQTSKIGASITRFGWTHAILTDEHGVIVAGHGRWLAAKQIGCAEVPIRRLSHLTKDDLRAYRLADNRLAELAGIDKKLLAGELEYLSSIELDFDIGITGYETAEVDVLIEELHGEEAEADPADAEMPLEAVAVSEVGDLWLLDKHRLLCGSSLEPISFLTLMDGKQARAVFEDAPYNTRVDGKISGLGKTKHREFEMAAGEMSDTEFTGFLTDNLRCILPHIVEGAILFLCMDWRNIVPLHTAITTAGLTVQNLAVWNKGSGGMGSLYRSQHELIFVAKKGKAPHVNNVMLGKYGRTRTNVWKFRGVNSFGRGRMEQLSVHPTCKPIPLVAEAIRDVSRHGEIVLDSFMGSGTTLLAAERTGRIAYGMDLDPLYVDVAIRRWEKMTGKVAVLAETGESFAAVAARRTTA